MSWPHTGLRLSRYEKWFHFLLFQRANIHAHVCVGVERAAAGQTAAKRAAAEQGRVGAHTRDER